MESIDEHSIKIRVTTVLTTDVTTANNIPTQSIVHIIMKDDADDANQMILDRIN